MNTMLEANQKSPDHAGHEQAPGHQAHASAMAAGITDKLWSMEDVVALLDVREAPPKRGSHKRRPTQAERPA